MLSNIQKS